VNLLETRYCLLCNQVIRRNQPVAVLANVLYAHEQCALGHRHD
jgi:hypothetical protein